MGCGAGAGRLRRACTVRGRGRGAAPGKSPEGAGVEAQRPPDRPGRPAPRSAEAGGPREWQGGCSGESRLSPTPGRTGWGTGMNQGLGLQGTPGLLASACLMLVPIRKARPELVLSSPTRPRPRNRLQNRPQNREPCGSAPFLQPSATPA